MSNYTVKLRIEKSSLPSEGGGQVFTEGDTVKGKAYVYITKDTMIKSIGVYLVGFVLAEGIEKKNQVNHSAKKRTTTDIIVSEVHHFYLDKKLLFPSSSVSKSESALEIGPNELQFYAKSKHEFSFEFPLPPICKCDNCDYLGDFPPSFEYKDDGSRIKIGYKVMIDIKEGGILSEAADLLWNPSTVPSAPSASETFRYKPMLNGRNKEFQDNLTMRRVKKVFQYDKKVKKRIDDPVNTGSITKSIPNPIDDDHKYSRYFRGLWDNNYKAGNYAKLVSDVSLELVLETEKRIFFPGELLSKAENEYFINVYVGSNSLQNLEPDYVLKNGESSGLGEFTIRDFSIKLIELINITLEGKVRTVVKEYELYSNPYPIEYTFDLARLPLSSPSSSSQAPSRFYRIPLKDIITDLDYFKSVMISADLGQSFKVCNVEKQYKLVTSLNIPKNETSKNKNLQFETNIDIINLESKEKLKNYQEEIQKKGKIDMPKDEPPAYEPPSNHGESSSRSLNIHEGNYHDEYFDEKSVPLR